jgi:ATP-dependent DNA ligase
VYELHEAIKNGLSNYRLIYVVFDILYLNGVELIEVPYKERKKLRQQLFKAMRGVQPIGIELREVETVEVYNKKGLIDVYNQYVQAGFEGAIIKDPDAPYELGKRSNKWLKLKPKETIDCTITGIVPIQGNTGMRVWGLRYAVRDEQTGGYIDLGMIRGIDAAAGTRLAELIIAGGLINPQAGLVDLSSDLKAKSRFAQSKDTMGFEIIPDIVINIDSLGIVRNQGKKTFKLRNARFLHIREDKPVEDIASYYEVYNNYDL